MYFAKYGSGENIFVGLHGWSGDHRTFFPLIKYLPENVTFYSADLPGNGNSPAPNEWTITQLVQEIATGIELLPNAPMTILGSCSGGLLGLFVAKYLLEKGQTKNLKRLVLIDPFAYFPWYFKVFIAPQMGKIGWYAYYTTFANPLGRLMTNLSLRQHRTEGTHLTDTFSKVNHEVTYRYLQLLSEGGSAEQFSVVTVPVTIVHGEKTFGAIRESLRRWQKILPSLSSHELAGTGHLPIVENPAGLAEILFKNDQLRTKSYEQALTKLHHPVSP